MNIKSSLLGSLSLAIALILLPSCSQRVVVKQKLGAIVGQQADLKKARVAWQKIKSGTATEKDRSIYNQAVDQVLIKVAGKSMPSADETSMKLLGLRERITVELDPDRKGDLQLSSFDHMYVSDYVRIKRGLERLANFPGFGASLALCTPPSDADPFIAPEGLWRPATAILEFNGEDDRARLVIYDPLYREQINEEGQIIDLAADFSVPLATSFALRDKQLFHLPAMLHYERFENKLGLVRLSPLDPKKTPCILVHGLKSSPATWKEALNKILSNPDLREKYEFWNYGYPTGAPIPYSSMRLRKDIDSMHDFRVAQGGSGDEIVVVGHSMGGLLAKSLTQSSGDENWSKIFTIPVSELNLSEENTTLLRDMIYFEPVPSVKRVIYIATPHGGSDIAQNIIGELSSKLIDLPQQLVNISTELLNVGRKSITPLGLEIAANPPTSIDGLRPTSPILTLMGEMPVKQDVVRNSIIGIECEFDGPAKKWTDGAVPYGSASIPGVESEVIIPNTNHSVHKTPGGIAELERILCHHAGIPVPDDVMNVLNEIGRPKSIPVTQQSPVVD